MTDLVPTAQAAPGNALVELLDLEHVEADTFCSRTAGEPGGRIFGGEMCAQALVAAERTVDTGYRPHSLHTYFLRPGRTGVPLTFRIQRPHNGRTFQRRHVTAMQHDKPVLSLEASFTTTAADTSHGVSSPSPLPASHCRPLKPLFLKGWTVDPATAFDIRTAAPTARTGPTGAYDMWFRLRADTVDDRVSTAALLTYITDYQLVTAVLQIIPHNGSSPTSLDHSVWFHSEPRMDDWLYYAKNVAAAGTRRGLAEGRLFHRDGTLLASTAQEGLIQPPSTTG